LVALIGSLIFATVAEVYTFIGWYFKRWFVDNQVAQSGGSTSAQWQDYFESFFIWFLILSFIQFVIFLYSAFAAYICIPGESTLRRVFAVANLAMCTLGGLVLYLCYVSYDYISLGNLVNLPSKSIVDLLWWIALVTIIASIVGILINLRRSKVLYFILGGALLICWAIAITQVPSTLRQERQSYGNAFPNCQSNMQQLHKDFIENNLGCPNKYSTTNDCSKDARALNWESDEGKAPTSKTFADACLNRACCGVITSSILSPFAKLGVWGLFWVVAIAITSAVAIKIARRNGILTPNANRFVEYLCGGLQFVAILLFLILILTRSSSNPKLNPASYLQQSANTEALPLPPDQLRNYPCLGMNFDAQLDSLVLLTTGCVDDPTCANQGIRLALYSDKVSTISLPSGYQNDTLRFLNPAALDQAGEFVAKDGSKITLAVEGTKDTLKKFLKEDARVCIQPSAYPADATKDVNATIKLKWRQVTLSNSLKITDPLLTTTGNDTKSAAIKQPDPIRFQATQNPWSAVNYTLHVVLQKVATDANGNALLTPFKKTTPSGQIGSCNYARKVIPYPYSEDLTWDDKACDVDWLPITLDDTPQQEGAFIVASQKLLQNYQPYAVRFFVQCFEFDKDKYSNLREYSAYKDIIIGGYPRISTQDLGVIVMKRTDFKTDQVALGARRVLTQVKKVASPSVRTVTAKPVTYDESGTAQPAVVPTAKSTLTLNFVDAATNTPLTNGGAFVTPVREYPTGKQVKDGYGLSSNKDKSLVKCVQTSNLFKDQLKRTSVRENVLNGTSTVTVSAGFHNITAARILNTKDYTYHSYNNPNFLAYGRSANLPLTIPLVPRASNASQIQLLLEWGSQTLDLDLFVTFNVNGGANTCLVGYSQKSCGGATYHADNWNGSEYGGELVTINLRNDATYLVYVKAYTGSNTGAKNTKTLGKEPYYSNPNNFITDSFARVSVFVNNINETAMSFPVPGLNKNQDLNGLPTNSANQVDKTKLVWEAVCIKGSIGARSICPIGQILETKRL
jgi:hypothetical protein